MTILVLLCAVLGVIVLGVAMVCHARPRHRDTSRFLAGLGVGMLTFAYGSVLFDVLVGGIHV